MYADIKMLVAALEEGLGEAPKEKVDDETLSDAADAPKADLDKPADAPNETQKPERQDSKRRRDSRIQGSKS